MQMFELVTWFQKEYPELVKSMHESSHHNVGVDFNPYHLEGDVWTHTMMVCKQAENMPYEVQIAALLHDIGKPSTRKLNPKNGRVAFFNHDAVSAFMSLEILNREELGLDNKQKADIFNLIALHTQVYKLGAKKLAAIGNINLVGNLLLLGKADHEGRFHSHEGAEIPTFDEMLGEYQASRYIDVSKEVHILCGLPASGKSTWAISDNNIPTVISRDAFIEFWGKGSTYNEKWKSVNQRAVDNCIADHFKQCSSDERVIVDMTHMSKKSRKRSLSHFGIDYKKICHVFLTDLPTINLRNSQRHGKFIVEDVYKRMMESFYPPTLEEFDEIIYHL